MSSIKKEKREKRHRKIRSRVSGTKNVPRLSVYKSNKFVFAQLIDDDAQKTLAALSSKDVKTGKTMVEKAKETGKEIAKKASVLKIEKVVFDRGGFKYIGKIKAIADGAREGGLKF
ncbi:MAG: 50S ribosomal protein L18 [Candidatus Taylorbacteria bacterium]|nr:50S ribosomal protein L18 [Candidatus Taylorbacteria bacterium]